MTYKKERLDKEEKADLVLYLEDNWAHAEDPVIFAMHVVREVVAWAIGAKAFWQTPQESSCPPLVCVPRDSGANELPT